MKLDVYVGWQSAQITLTVDPNDLPSRALYISEIIMQSSVKIIPGILSRTTPGILV